MMFILFLLASVLGEDEPSTSITDIITNTRLGSLTINTARTTSTSASSSSSSTSKITTSALPSSLTTEDDNDKSIFKLLFTKSATDYYYDIPVTMGGQEMGLRLDLLQNNIWVMNDDYFLSCEEINSWWSSQEQIWGTVLDNDTASLPASVTTAPEYVATACAGDGSFTTSDDFDRNMSDSRVSNLENFQQIRVPYIDAINVTGEVLTSDFSVLSTNNQSVMLKNFTFINANSSSVSVGGFGLAGNLLSDSGFTNGLMSTYDSNVNGYSLYFNKFTESNMSFAQVLPGVVDKKYFIDDLYSFDLLDHTGSRYTSGQGLEFENSLMDYMIIPSIQIDDILMENGDSGETLTLKGDRTDGYGVIFDTRTIFNSLPLDVIINIAIQTNAYYNEQAERWIVECETIRNVNALIDFKFGDLEIRIPLNNFLINATSDGDPLLFNNGEAACYLKFLPTSNTYLTLGLSFLEAVYLVVDNVGSTIGIAKTNDQLVIKEEDYLPQQKQGDFKGFDNSNSSDVTTIGSISSGVIPFATHVNYTTHHTLTYLPFNSASDSLTIPGRFSGNLITSNEIFATQNSTSGVSLASTTSERSGGNGEGPKSWFWVGFLLPLSLFVL
ncbi:aspartic proteinase yapsin-7 [[Candida] jaroonii]|uniref:Aspartic proteinase yapsin-7 n=1 Tax=[Candida] jaroonii TaxID=467808 RepID=A0ACA9Y4F8_9ASCO|nr:aspartic proteinase yapsin-7 [[Candida] jaroonii]